MIYRMIDPSLPVRHLPRPGHLTGAATPRPSFFFTPPNRLSVGQREGRLSERSPPGFGGEGALRAPEGISPVKAIVSRTISALHHSLDMLLHATAKPCPAPGKCADRQKPSDDGKRDHVMRSNVVRAVRQIFFASSPKSLGRQFWRREQTKIFMGGDEYERF